MPHHSKSRWPAVIGSVMSAALLFGAADVLSAQGVWTPTGSMAAGRQGHTATLLPSGKLLVLSDNDTSPELYDPKTGFWWPTGAPAAPIGGYHTATLLQSGKVLVIGTDYTGSVYVIQAQLYDPVGGVWSVTSAPARGIHTATVLPSGKVLAISFLYNLGHYVNLVTLYDPADETWSPTGSLIEARAAHSATVLRSGKVLVVGGFKLVTQSIGAFPVQLASAEVYDPLTGTWSSAAYLPTRRSNHTATRLASGKVLVAGGIDANGHADRTALLYDESTESWTATGSLNTPRAVPTATLLPSGRVLVVGDKDADPSAGEELYDPPTGLWYPIEATAIARNDHTATLLRSGAVLVSGGSDGSGSGPLASAELFQPEAGTCAEDVTPDVNVFRFPVDPVLFYLFRFEWVIVHNNTGMSVPGPLSFAMDDLRGALFVGSTSSTRCFSPADGVPLLVVPPGTDNIFTPNEFLLLSLWFFRPFTGPIHYVPVVLSGVPLQ